MKKTAKCLNWIKEKDLSDKFWNRLLWIALILAVIPLLWIANFNHSMSDDWIYGVKLHEVIVQGGFHPILALKAVIGWIISYWHGWQGTYSAILLFQLQPAVWGEEFYRLGTYILSFCVIASTVYFFRALFTGVFSVSRVTSDMAACLVLLLWFELMPSPVQGLYWWNGASYYVIFCALMLCLCGKLINMQTLQKCSLIEWVLLIFLAFFLGGGNFITALLTCEILFVNLMFSFWKKNKCRIVSVVIFVINLGGFLLSALAPGNAHRQAEYEQFSPLKAVIFSFSEAYFFLEEYTSLYVLLALLFLIPFFWKVVRCDHIKKTAIPYLVWVLAAFCFFASSFTPNLYAYGSAGPGRIQNIRYWIMCVLYVILLFLAVVRIKALLMHVVSEGKKHSSAGGFAYVGVILFFVIVFSLSNCREEYKDQLSTVSAVYSLHRGEAQAYDKEWDDRIDQLLHSDEQNLVFKRIQNKPYLIYFQDIFSDETQWRNQVCAEYYHKESVRTKKKKNRKN